MKKRILIVAVAVCCIFSVFAQGRNKNDMFFEISVSGAFATGFGQMNDYLSTNPSIVSSTYATDFDNIKMGQIGFGWSGNYFIANGFAFQFGLKYLSGQDFSAEDERHASSDIFTGLVGVEYYFYRKNNIALSANVDLACDVMDFDYGIYNGIWNNYSLPLGVTFWYDNLGFQLNYAPTIIKLEPKKTNGVDLPKTSINNLLLNIRISL